MNAPTLQVIDGRAITTSVAVADFFKKRHGDVLRAIKNVLEHVSEAFNRRNFASVSGTDAHSQRTEIYQMTKDGFAMIVLGFTGKDAIQFREAYITRFNDMENRLRRQAYRQNMLTSPQIDQRVQVVLGNARSDMTLTFAFNLMMARGLHIPPISRDQMIKLIKTGVIDGYFDNRQWHVYQDSFADWLEQRKLAA